MKILYITCKDKNEAGIIAKHCVEKRLAACGNNFPMNSCYFWEGKVNNEKEYVLLLKTNDKLVSKLKIEVTRVHSYAVPCILEIDVKPNKEYEKWMNI